MNIIYRITSPQGPEVAYARNLRAADWLESVVVRNGCEVKVERLKRSEVPLSEIHLINASY